MTSSTNSFYVTLFSNALREIYENNTHADFTVKLWRPIELGTSPNCEVSYSSPPPASLNTVDVTPCADHAMIYCNILSPQFVADSTVRQHPSQHSLNYASVRNILSKSHGSRSHPFGGDRPRLFSPALPTARPRYRIFLEVCFGGPDLYCGAGPKLWVARRCVNEARS